MRNKVNEYRPNIIKLNDFGTKLDTLMRDVQTAPSRPHRRSSQVMMTSTPKPGGRSKPAHQRKPFDETQNMSGLFEGTLLRTYYTIFSMPEIR